MGVFGINLNTAGLGLGSGLNVQQTVSQLVAAAQQSEAPLLQEQQLYTSQTSALNNINTLLGNLQTAVSALQDPLGALSAETATSSNTSVLTATAGSGATTGSHTITVNSLATTSSYYTGALASGDTTFGTGQFTLQVGSNAPVTITVNGSNDTLNTLASYINSQNYGVTASVITDSNGARLSLVSNTSGAAGDLTISGNTTGLSFTKAVTGANASLTVDGVPISSASNTVTGVIPDVTLNLTGTSTSAVTLTLNPDTSQATTAINNFVSAYNAVVQAVNAQYTVTPGASQQPPLLSDSSLSLVQNILASDLNYTLTGNNGITSLASLGITVNNDGTLSVDNGALTSALNNNFSAVQSFFQQTSSPNGFAVNFYNSLQSLTDPASGPLNIDLQGISQEQQSISQQISDFQANLAQQQQTWIQEYSQINATLQQLPLLISQINGQLSSLGGISSAAPSSSSSSLA
ncbi:MAG TPA: flagellar filament capping protein FliD [Terriglobia bacterium]|nr:flagellar filament capping protein FliD [Terriglobia bacterium]